MRRDIRLLLVGDEGVGKSTIINTIIKGKFMAEVQHLMPEVIIPPELAHENVTLHIVDSSSRQEHCERLEAEIRRAHVICIVYAVNDPNTFNRIPLYWLPYIRSLGVNVPSLLVGNKTDLSSTKQGAEGYEQGTEEEDKITIMNEFKEVACVECSAQDPASVTEVFNRAQMTVLYPITPLYDAREQSLKPPFLDALKRIFKLCDTDKDGVLNDEELNELQRQCFGKPLTHSELIGVKEKVQKHKEGSFDETGLTEDGFATLNDLFIQQNFPQVPWTILRKFGYGEDLSLRESFVLPPFEVPPECSVELSPHGYQFFTELFKAFDKDKDGALKHEELQALFTTSPGNPWADTEFPHTTITTETGFVTLQGWLAQWSMTTLLDHKTTLKYLAYLGYEGDTRLALKITRPKKVDRKKGKIRRNVFLCYVLGAPGSGKTSLMKAFVNKPFSKEYQSTTSSFGVVNSVEMKGSEKYLVMEEIDQSREAHILSSKKLLEACDLLCFVYDSSDANSFGYVTALRETYKVNHVPMVFVATKCELDLVTQRHEIQPDTYCHNLGLAVPLSVSVKEHQMADLYHILTGVAMNPTIATPRSAREESWLSHYYITASVVAGVAILAGLAGYKLFKQHTISLSTDAQQAAFAAAKRRTSL